MSSAPVHVGASLTECAAVAHAFACALLLASPSRPLRLVALAAVSALLCFGTAWARLGLGDGHAQAGGEDKSLSYPSSWRAAWRTSGVVTATQLMWTVAAPVLTHKYLEASARKRGVKTTANDDDQLLRRAITMQRAAMVVLTCACIHAVDYETVFPPSFHKATAYGAGLMDVGSGSFVFAAGLVSARRTSSLHKAVVCIALGAGRCALVRLSNYAVPPEEYGRDWNFFFTLAGLHVIKDLLAFVPPAVAATTTMALHEVVFLRLANGYEYVHRDPSVEMTLGGTTTWWAWLGIAPSPPASPSNVFHGVIVPELVHANKEGLGSLLGYASLYFAAVALGRACRSWEIQGRHVVHRLLMLTVMCYSAVVALGGAQAVSRRSCNLQYVLWMIAYNAGVLAMFRASAPHLAPRKRGDIYDIVNRHMLSTFLVANLLTGAAKLSGIASDARDLPFALFGTTVYMGLVLGTILLLPGPSL
ncbi:glucosaminylphosphatidylinositol acyltransferase [Pycnococcus provasolii]